MTSPDSSVERDSRGLRAVRPAGPGLPVPRPWGSSPLDALPLGLTSFVGREREIADVRKLLSERRLLTLCGSGGAGQTRLPLAVAQGVGGGLEGGAGPGEDL